MTTPLESLVACGTKLWLDSIDPDLVRRDRALGATGATSNPIIVADLIKTGRFDELLGNLLREGLDDEEIAWRLTDQLVREAQQVFLPVWEQTRGNDGYVSFELDPLLEDPGREMSARGARRAVHRAGQEVVRRAQEPHDQGAGDARRPGRAGGAGRRRRDAQRDAHLLRRGSTRPRATPSGAAPSGAASRETFKSVYSIFVSRLDVYTEKHVPQLSPAAQGRSASSTPSASGVRTPASGPTRSCRWRRR